MEQQKEISVLRGEVSTLRRIQQSSINGAANDDNTNSVSKIIEQSMLRNQVQLKQLVDAAIANRFLIYLELIYDCLEFLYLHEILIYVYINFVEWKRIEPIVRHCCLEYHKLWVFKCLKS